MISQYHADKITKVAAQLAAERFGGWSNPLVVDLVNTATFLLGGEGGSPPGPHGAVLSTTTQVEGSGDNPEIDMDRAVASTPARAKRYARALKEGE